MTHLTPTIIVAVALSLTAVCRAQDAPAPEAPAAPAAPEASLPGAGAEAEADLLRIREQLDRVLSDSGLPVGEARDQTAAQIEALAQRSNVYSKQAPSPRARLEAGNLELRSYNALAQQAYRDQQTDEGASRNRQLRAAAEEVKAIPEPAAETVGDFWLLQADLLDLNNSAGDVPQRQRRAIARLEQFVAARQKAGDAVEHDEAARQIATDVRLSLLRLYDDRGDSAKACAAVTELGAQADATDDATLREHLAQWYGYCDVLGQRFEATLPHADGRGQWSTSDAAGKPVLMHVWASWWPASHASLGKLTEAYPRLRERGVEVVSIDLGPAAPASKLADAKASQQSRGRASVQALAPQAQWTQCAQPAAVNLQALLRIRSLPRYVLLDEQGRVAALGGSLSILDQLSASAPAGEAPAPPSVPAAPATEDRVAE